MEVLRAFVTDVYPQAVGLGTVAGMAILLSIPSLVWHSKHRNFAPAYLIACILIMNIFNFVNPIIWPNDRFDEWFNGVGLCDIHSKIIVANSTSLPAATLCILKKLADVMETNKINLAPSKAQRTRRAAIEGFLCIGIPVLTMILHFIVQASRYAIIGVSGCIPVLSNTWLSVVFIIMPPTLLALVNVYFAVLIMVRLRVYRSRFDTLLSASSTTKSRFLRLFLLSLTFVVIVFPIQVFLTFKNWPRNPQPYSWESTHNYRQWRNIGYLPSLGQVLVDRWVQVGCGYLVFIFFGLGKEAKDMYKSWALTVGLGGLAKFLPKKTTRARSSDTGRSSVLVKARIVFLSSFSSKSYDKTSFSNSTNATSVADLEMQSITCTTTVTSDHTDRSLLNEKPEPAVTRDTASDVDGSGKWSSMSKMIFPVWRRGERYNGR
ncbi:Pheromone a factor receptor [Sphaceloma murrayae]|uniref:Pheromone a factor receptor n=1 Tax=Sphaceloma murrayae TaxID=2082308 RepID=A0A2K1QJR8_9PEZI|nr:Pheromone a factor receptor [Sphaceloma murrayae]